MSKQISTKTTIRNLTAEIKKTFVKKDAFTPVQTASPSSRRAWIEIRNRRPRNQPPASRPPRGGRG